MGEGDGSWVEVMGEGDEVEEGPAHERDRRASAHIGSPATHLNI